MQQQTRSQPNPGPRTSELVERAAREAQRKLKPRRNLLRDGFPFDPGLWNIVVEPIEVKTESEGGIILAEVSQQAEGYQVTVGQVVKAGPQSMIGKTSSGIDLSHFLDGVRTREDLIGIHAMYQLHTGQRMTLRETDEYRECVVIVMKVADLLGRTEDPEAWRFYV